MLNIGDPAPAVELPGAEMEMVNLSSYLGASSVVLYFYPKDDTPGCTLEAVEFSDLADDFAASGAVIIGVSMDDCLAHAAFRDKHGIGIELLADPEGEACERYGVLQEREVEGHRRTAIQRSTFVIDRQGRLRHALYGVSPRGHAAHVLNLVKELD